MSRSRFIWGLVACVLWEGQVLAALPAPEHGEEVTSPALGNPKPEVEPHREPSSTKKKPQKPSRRRLPKKRRSLRSSESAAVSETQIFGESTQFESLLATRSPLSRGPASTFTASARVIVIRRELGLTEAETAQSPQDIVLNAGTEGGLQEGMTLSVSRSVPILDPYKESRQTFLQIEFAKIKIIHSQENLSVARLEKLESAKGTPSVGTRAVLVGDYVGKFD